MELWFNTGSPFARKVRILVREKGLLTQISERLTNVSPIVVNQDLAQHNPLIKIPMLVLDNGETLFDSRVICEYLDDLRLSDKALPVSGSLRFAALRRQALADGICDAAVLCRYEQAVRPENLQWTAWIDGQMCKITGALAALEREAEHWSEDLDIGQIAVVAALGYLDFRFRKMDWRTGHPHLAAWSARMAGRPSVLATAPM